MISTIFVGLMTAFGESMGMTSEQALFSSTLVYPVMLPAVFGLLWTLVDDLLGLNSNRAMDEKKATERNCKQFLPCK